MLFKSSLQTRHCSSEDSEAVTHPESLRVSIKQGHPAPQVGFTHSENANTPSTDEEQAAVFTTHRRRCCESSRNETNVSGS